VWGSLPDSLPGWRMACGAILHGPRVGGLRQAVHRRGALSLAPHPARRRKRGGVMANWQDVTSYSQSHPRGTVEPKSWELAGSSPRIVVTRYLGAPGWYLRTEGLDLVHLGEDLERAKAEAVRLVRERLTRMLDSLPPSVPWRPIEECGELARG